MPRSKNYGAYAKGDQAALRIIERTAKRPRKAVRKRPAKLRYNIGDQCWITINAALLVRGVVIAHFKHPSYPNVFYIIQVADEEHPFLELRDALTMKPNKTNPFPFWQHTEKDLPRRGN